MVLGNNSPANHDLKKKVDAHDAQHDSELESNINRRSSARAIQRTKLRH